MTMKGFDVGDKLVCTNDLKKHNSSYCELTLNKTYSIIEVLESTQDLLRIRILGDKGNKCSFIVKAKDIDFIPCFISEYEFKFNNNLNRIVNE